MIHLKCVVVHYANINSSSINKPYLWVVEYDILGFFSNSYFCQKLKKKKTIIFKVNFQKSFQDLGCMLKNIRM